MWFTNTLLSRLNDKRTGAIIIVMQRVHMDDLTGHVLQGANDWEVLNLPAIAVCDEVVPLMNGRNFARKLGSALAPEREPLHILEALRRDMGSDIFEAQYQQQPVPPGGLMVKRDWVKRYREIPSDVRGWAIIQSWDTAAKGGPENDWSVCTTWLRGFDARHYLLHLWRGRVDYPTLKQTVIELAAEFGATQVLMEDATTATGLLQELNFTVIGLTGIKPDRDKISRMAIASVKFEAGQVFLPEDAPWLAELESELFSFPGARFDDQVDSISQALNHQGELEVWAKLAGQ